MDGTTTFENVRHRNPHGSHQVSLPTQHPSDAQREISPTTKSSLTGVGYLAAVKDTNTSLMKKQRFGLPRTFSEMEWRRAAVPLLLGLFLLVVLRVKAVLAFLVDYRRNSFQTAHRDTFAYECRQHYLNNYTWGQAIATHVDKLQVKDLIASILRAEGLENNFVRVPRTLAHYDPNTISLFTLDVMRSLPQPYIIKSTHNSGGVARVMNDTYECFKDCRYHYHERISPLSKAFGPAAKNIRHNIHRQFSSRELQYQDLPHRVLIEEHLPMDDMHEFHWFAVNGHALFARGPCYYNAGPRKRASFFSAAFGKLPKLCHVQPRPCDTFEKPKAFSRMMEAVRVIGKHLPGVVRMDFYVNDFDVYFGELTYTTGACKYHLKPIVADRLLYAVHYGNISPSRATPEFVERLINETPWFRVNMKGDSPQLSFEAMAAYSSETDLCDKMDAPANCLYVSRSVSSFPLRCIMVQDNDVTALGKENLPWMSTLVGGIDIPCVLVMVAILIMMKYLNLGGKPGRRIQNNALFLVVVTLYNCLKAQEFKSFLSLTSLPFIGTARRSFEAFVMVHPVEDKVLAVGHFTTYWFAIAAWRAKTIRRMLFWWLMYEVVAVGVTECIHHFEAYGEIQCARMSFLHSMQRYALDETIRKYILPPFFVYGYLLPRQLLCCLGLADCSSNLSDFQLLYRDYH